MKLISVVIPIYRCSESIPELTTRLHKVLRSIAHTSYEIIFVDDGSPDRAWVKIQQACRAHSCVKGIRLSRNFGQHYAITAGIQASTGTWVVVMDGDLQDQPEDIVSLFKKATNGFDVVWAQRKKRQDSVFRWTVSRMFHTIFAHLSGLPGDVTVGNFSIVHMKVISVIKKMQEQNRSYLQSVKWAGFKQGYVPVTHIRRPYGKPSYTLGSLCAYAIDSITAYSNTTLKLAIIVGFFICFISFIMAFVIIIRYITKGIPVTGWASLIVSMYFLFGLVFSYLGVFGLYLGKVFDESKKRPLFVIAETIGVRKTS